MYKHPFHQENLASSRWFQLDHILCRPNWKGYLSQECEWRNDDVLLILPVFTAMNTHLLNTMLSLRLRCVLNKYRDWLIVAYKKLIGGDKSCLIRCRYASYSIENRLETVNQMSIVLKESLQ